MTVEGMTVEDIPVLVACLIIGLVGLAVGATLAVWAAGRLKR